MMPVMTALSDAVAIFGAYLVAISFVGINSDTFYNGFKMFFTLSDFSSGLIKSVVFGFIIAVMGCYHGFFTTGGAMV